jgi:hypothetical protein
MIMSYKFQAAQMNKEPPQESSLNLTLTQHPHDENPKLQKVRPCFKVDSLTHPNIPNGIFLKLKLSCMVVSIGLTNGSHNKSTLLDGWLVLQISK